MGLCPEHPEQCHLGIPQKPSQVMADEEAKQKEALNATLKEYISEWRATREKEEEELKKLKEKQAKRKEIRAEQEKKLNQQKKEEEEKLRKEEADKRAAEAEEKKKRLEEAEAKRQEMLDAQKADKAGAAAKKSTAGTEGNDARKEMTKTKEQLEEEKKIALSIRIKPLDLEAMDSDDLKAKATELFNIVIQLETDKYDYEQKGQQQERDLQELKERQKAQLRQKALKKGLDPEALVGKYPPMIRMYSKYERRTDTRTYEDRKSCTRAAGRSSVPSPWTPSGRRSTRSGPRGLPRSCPSGSERGLARRLVMPPLPRGRM